MRSIGREDKGLRRVRASILPVFAMERGGSTRQKKIGDKILFLLVINRPLLFCDRCRFSNLGGGGKKSNLRGEVVRGCVDGFWVLWGQDDEMKLKWVYLRRYANYYREKSDGKIEKEKKKKSKQRALRAHLGRFQSKIQCQYDIHYPPWQDT
jgi:hypothetical protein